MAATTTNGTAAAVHLEGIDFAGKTGTAQIVSHSAGATSLGKGAERANAWFVGMAPRRNPDIVVAVLVEHGGWGAEASAPLAAQVINALRQKQRKRANNIRTIAETPKPASRSHHPTRRQLELFHRDCNKAVILSGASRSLIVRGAVEGPRDR